MKRLFAIIIFTFLLTGCIFAKGEVNIKLNKGIDTIEVHTLWVDSGATATDEEGKSLKVTIVKNNLNIEKLGTYEVTYQAKNSSGKTKQIIRKVTVIDETKPQITLNKGVDTIKVGESWKDSGVTAVDNYDGDLTNKVEVIGSVNVNLAGQYIITYKVVDSSGNTATIKRYVNVIEKD